MTAVSRASSSSTFPEGVAVEKVDLASLESVRAALAGHDAVVSTVATVSVGGQHVLVDAAIAAGVRRFVPSEFGINTRIVGDTPIGKILTGKVATVDYLTSKADENPWFSWTAITTGFFFDWVGRVLLPLLDVYLLTSDFTHRSRVSSMAASVSTWRPRRRRW